MAKVRVRVPWCPPFKQNIMLEKYKSSPKWQFRLLKQLCELSGLDYSKEVWIENAPRRRENARIRRVNRTAEERAEHLRREKERRIVLKASTPEDVLKKRLEISREREKERERKDPTRRARKAAYHKARLETERKKDREDRETLGDNYIKSLLRFSDIDATPEIIALKRLSVKLKRACKIANPTATLPELVSYSTKVNSKIYATSYYLSHKEALLEYGRVWRACNKDYAKEWRTTNRDYAKAWREANADKVNKYAEKLRLKKIAEQPEERVAAEEKRRNYDRKRYLARKGLDTEILL